MEPDGLRRRRKGLGQISSSYFPRTECCPGQSESLIANDVMGMMFPGIPSSQCCQRVLEAPNKQLCRLAMNVRVVSPPIANYSCITAIRRDNSNVIFHHHPATCLVSSKGGREERGSKGKEYQKSCEVYHQILRQCALHQSELRRHLPYIPSTPSSELVSFPDDLLLYGMKSLACETT